MLRRTWLTILWCASMALLSAVTLPATVAALPKLPALGCPVSQPMRDTPPSLEWSGEPVYFGHGDLWTSLWPDSRVVFEPGGAGFVLPDGAMGMKWPFIPFIDGDLSITGQRLDGPAAPLRSEIIGRATLPDGQEFFPVYLIFPTPGCWEVTGRVGDASLTFVTLVVKIGDGPNWHPESEP